MNYKLSKYIVPSVVIMLLMGTYTNIDGFFIGNAAGDSGLAAINIVWPIVAFINSLGCGIGIGGSVIMNSIRGFGDESRAESAKKSIIALLIISGIFTSIILSVLYAPLLRMMGAEGEVYVYACDYAAAVCGGAVFQVAGMGLLALLRNDNKTYLSMTYSIIGLIIHIAADWMLVGTYGLLGIGISTVFSQLVTAVLCIITLRVKKHTRTSRKLIFKIMSASTAPFGVNFVSSVVLMLTNYFALKTGGTAAVSAYAVMSYAIYTFDYVFQGVCDGVQPVISYCSGSNDISGERRAMRAGAAILAICSICFMSLTPVLSAVMPMLFGVSHEAENMIRTGFVIYALSYPFKAAVKYICSYYYASGKFALSNIMTYIDPIIVTPLLLTALVFVFGVNGIWLSMTLSQLIITIVGMISFIIKKKGVEI